MFALVYDNTFGPTDHPRWVYIRYLHIWSYLVCMWKPPRWTKGKVLRKTLQVLAVPGEVPISKRYLLEQGSCSRATETHDNLVGQRSQSNRNNPPLPLVATADEMAIEEEPEREEDFHIWQCHDLLLYDQVLILQDGQANSGTQTILKCILLQRTKSMVITLISLLSLWYAIYLIWLWSRDSKDEAVYYKLNPWLLYGFVFYILI
jgi:hypothetical protein